MKNLNQLISGYTSQLQQGDIQLAYKGILEYIGKLRADIVKKYPSCDISSIYQGYMDMSYFSLSTKILKDKGLKIAIVYVHRKGQFEAWLSGRNREISKQYEPVFYDRQFDKITVFHDETNMDAIIECILTDKPSFDHQDVLSDIIMKGVEEFVSDVDDCLI